MVVGDAPGANEDETGRPFVGAAGQLLTKILGAINLASEAQQPDTSRRIGASHVRFAGA